MSDSDDDTPNTSLFSAADEQGFIGQIDKVFEEFHEAASVQKMALAGKLPQEHRMAANNLLRNFGLGISHSSDSDSEGTTTTPAHDENNNGQQQEDNEPASEQSDAIDYVDSNDDVQQSQPLRQCWL